MSTQPGDPRPHDRAPHASGDRPGETGTPPPGFGAQVKALLANRYVLALIAIVVVLIVVLMVIVANSEESSSDGPEPGAAVPALRAPAAPIPA